MCDSEGCTSTIICVQNKCFLHCNRKNCTHCIARIFEQEIKICYLTELCENSVYCKTHCKEKNHSHCASERCDLKDLCKKSFCNDHCAIYNCKK